jgi:hypothetical protein
LLLGFKQNLMVGFQWTKSAFVRYINSLGVPIDMRRPHVSALVSFLFPYLPKEVAVVEVGGFCVGRPVEEVESIDPGERRTWRLDDLEQYGDSLSQF